MSRRCSCYLSYMNTKTLPIILLIILLFVGCCDTVNDHYATRAEAEADNLFERGWLPSIIPASARGIKTSNNLDINISEGEFRFDQEETNTFLEHLKPYSGQPPKPRRRQTYIAKQKKKGYLPFEYTDNDTVWIFMVNSRAEHVRYIMWIKNR